MGFWGTMNGIFRDRDASFANFITVGGHAQVSDLIDNFTGKTQNDWNNKQYQLQKDTLKYNKQLNELLMQREDTEYSRSISDMMSAGLNPAMLYGGSVGSLGSSAGNQLNTATSTQALPAGSLAELAGFVMNMKNVLSQVNRNDAEAENIRTSTEGKKLDNIYKQIENTYADIQKKQAIVSEWIKQHGNKYSNSLLEGEVKGRARDGSYQNQPVYTDTSGAKVKVGPVEISGNSSRSGREDKVKFDLSLINLPTKLDDMSYLDRSLAGAVLHSNSDFIKEKAYNQLLQKYGYRKKK